MQFIVFDCKNHQIISLLLFEQSILKWIGYFFSFFKPILFVSAIQFVQARPVTIIICFWIGASLATLWTSFQFVHWVIIDIIQVSLQCLFLLTAFLFTLTDILHHLWGFFIPVSLLTLLQISLIAFSDTLILADGGLGDILHPGFADTGHHYFELGPEICLIVLKIRFGHICQQLLNYAHT